MIDKFVGTSVENARQIAQQLGELSPDDARAAAAAPYYAALVALSRAVSFAMPDGRYVGVAISGQWRIWSGPFPREPEEKEFATSGEAMREWEATVKEEKR